MIILLDKKLTPQSKTWLFLLLVVLCGLPMWLSSYTQYLNHLWIGGSSVLVAAAGAGWLGWKTKHTFRFILGYGLGAQVLGFTGKLIIDCIPDPTNHNLFPFEMIFFLVIDLVLISILLFLVRSLKHDNRPHA